MATVSKPRLVAAHNDIDAGMTYVETYRVTDVTTTPEEDRVFEAMNAAGIPRKGEQHRSQPLLFAKSADATMLSETGTQWDITINWGQLNFGSGSVSVSEPGQIEVGATVQDVETFLDADGNEILVSHEFLIDDPDGGGGKIPDPERTPNPITDQPVAVMDSVANPVASLTRREPRNPLDVAIDVVGKVNSKSFLGAPPRYWLCTGIRSSSADDGLTWTTTYTFQYAEGVDIQRRPRSGWDASVRFRDPVTGEIPTGLQGPGAGVAYVGKRDVRVKKTYDFGRLRLEDANA